MGALAVAQTSLPDRVVKSFDFEEREAGNAEELPADWVKLEGSGFPHYVNGHLASDQAYRGKYSFRFDLHGGNLTYRYPTGKIPVSPFACYRISTMVKSAPMQHARSRLSGYFVNPHGKPIKTSIKHSDPYAGGAEWKQLQIEIVAPEDAAFLVIELELIQPKIWQASTLGNQALYEQDIDQTAWFDDVIISQVPRLNLSTSMPGNVFRLNDTLAIQIQIADLRKHDLDGTLVVKDSRGKIVFQRNGQLASLVQQQPSNGAIQKTNLVLPELQPGYYQAKLDLTSQGFSLGSGTLDFLKLADDSPQIDPDNRFSIIATDLPMSSWDHLAKLLPMLGAGHVKVSVWNSQTYFDTESQKVFTAFLEQLRMNRMQATACLVSPPPDVVLSIGGNTWGHLLKAPVTAWNSQLSYLVSRYNGQISTWQFGSDDQAELFMQSQTHRDAYKAFVKEFEDLVSNPRLAMPWPAYMETSSDTPRMLAINIPTDITPSQIPVYIEDFRKHNPTATSVVLNPLPIETYGREARLRDFFQRVVYTLSAGVDLIDLPLPYQRVGSGETAADHPDELFMVIRTLIKHLSLTRFSGKLPIGEDIDAFLFDRQGEGVVLMWSTADTKSTPKTAQIVLGSQPRKVDILGNVSPVLKPKDTSGMIELSVGTEPMILIGIDGELARFRSSFAIDNPMIESSFKPHVRKLSFTNPYNIPIYGKFFLTGPASWNLVPAMNNFSLNPGEKFECPVTIEFPYNSFAGIKPIECLVELQSGASRKITIPLSLKLGLGEIGMTTMAIRDGNDVIVQQVISNYSNKPVNYNAFAFVTGLARENRLVIDLKPGRTAIKKYRFKNVPFPANAAVKVRTGVKETEGTKILNDETTVK